MILSADTNFLLYAANPDSPYHGAAQRLLKRRLRAKTELLTLRASFDMQLYNLVVF